MGPRSQLVNSKAKIQALGLVIAWPTLSRWLEVLSLGKILAIAHVMGWGEVKGKRPLEGQSSSLSFLLGVEPVLSRQSGPLPLPYTPKKPLRKGNDVGQSDVLRGRGLVATVGVMASSLPVLSVVALSVPSEVRAPIPLLHVIFF